MGVKAKSTRLRVKLKGTVPGSAKLRGTSVGALQWALCWITSINCLNGCFQGCEATQSECVKPSNTSVFKGSITDVKPPSVWSILVNMDIFILFYLRYFDHKKYISSSRFQLWNLRHVLCVSKPTDMAGDFYRGLVLLQPSKTPLFKASFQHL